jgi:hypothetical protein
VRPERYEAERCCPPEIDEVYVCPTCEAEYADVDSAASCDGSHSGGILSDPLSLSVCPMCFAKHEEIRDAIDCCLWKRMGWPEA